MSYVHIYYASRGLHRDAHPQVLCSWVLQICLLFLDDVLLQFSCPVLNLIWLIPVLGDLVHKLFAFWQQGPQSAKEKPSQGEQILQLVLTKRYKPLQHTQGVRQRIACHAAIDAQLGQALIWTDSCDDCWEGMLKCSVHYLCTCLWYFCSAKTLWELSTAAALAACWFSSDVWDYLAVSLAEEAYHTSECNVLHFDHEHMPLDLWCWFCDRSTW